jgi:hypothetical protein
MTHPRRPGHDENDPLRRVVAEHWDEIAQLASEPQRERLLGLLDGTAEPDPAEARAALADELLDLLPPDHPVIRVLRTGIALRPSGMGAGTIAAGGPEEVVGGLPSERIIARGAILPVTIYLADEHIHAEVEAAVEAMLEAAGLRIGSREDPVRGSWFRRMSARARDGLLSPAGQEAARTAAHALDARLVLSQDAEVTARLMENLAPVLTALHPTKDAVIRVGALVVVKVDGSVSVYQLTPAQQLRLNHSPWLATAPADLDAALRAGQWESAGLDSGAAGRLGPAAALDALPSSPDRPGSWPEPAVTFGQPREVMVPDDELPSPVRRRPDLLQLWLTGVAVPFDLEEPPDGCRCTEAVVRITVDTPGVQGLWLTVPSTGGAADDPMDDARLDVRGIGTQQLTWKLTARSELIGLRPRGREVLAVLESSRQPAQLTGTLAATVRFTGGGAGAARTAEAGSSRFTLSLGGGIAGPSPG